MSRRANDEKKKIPAFLFLLLILLLLPPTLVTAKTGYLTVTAIPEPVKITIDGIEMEDAFKAGTIYELTPGTHTVLAEKEHFESQIEEVEVQVDRFWTLNLNMYESTDFRIKKTDDATSGTGEIRKKCPEEKRRQLERQRLIRKRGSMKKELEAKVAQEGIVLTDEQLAVLEKAKEEKQGHGEAEAERPDYLDSQDTFYIGTLQGVGWMYQQTFIDSIPLVKEKNLDKTLQEETVLQMSD